MKKFIAVEIDTKPFIVWVSTNLTEGSLVVDENDIPTAIYGVCPFKIVDGELVERTSKEMEAFQLEFETKENLTNQLNLLNGINAGTFVFDMATFPMDERSRLLYDALKNTSTAIPDTMIMNFEGKAYKLTEVNKADFLEAYYAKLFELSTPNFPVK